MNEQRASQRIRSYLKGVIVHSGGQSRTECTVRDLSAEGARLEVSRAVTLPETFDLHVPQRAMVQKSQIIWRHGDEAGVHFRRDAPPVPSPFDPAHGGDQAVLARLASLESEVASLRRQMLALRETLEHGSPERG